MWFKNEQHAHLTFPFQSRPGDEYIKDELKTKEVRVGSVVVATNYVEGFERPEIRAT